MARTRLLFLLLLLLPAQASARDEALAVPHPPPLWLSREGDPDRLDLLLDQLEQLEQERHRGWLETWRGALWLTLAVSVGVWNLQQDRDPRSPASLSWMACSAAGITLGWHTGWQGIVRIRRADAELEQVDRALQLAGPPDPSFR